MPEFSLEVPLKYVKTVAALAEDGEAPKQTLNRILLQTLDRSNLLVEARKELFAANDKVVKLEKELQDEKVAAEVQLASLREAVRATIPNEMTLTFWNPAAKIFARQLKETIERYGA
jgi:predicted NACHT family NTPase